MAAAVARAKIQGFGALTPGRTLCVRDVCEGNPPGMLPHRILATFHKYTL